jgi:hypothetical protein
MRLYSSGKYFKVVNTVRCCLTKAADRVVPYLVTNQKKIDIPFFPRPR